MFTCPCRVAGGDVSGGWGWGSGESWHLTCIVISLCARLVAFKEIVLYSGKRESEKLGEWGAVKRHCL